MSTRRGRPRRIDVERYPDGSVIRAQGAGPTDYALARRLEATGDAAVDAVFPLDLARARGFIDADRHRAGWTLAVLRWTCFGRSVIGARTIYRRLEAGAAVDGAGWRAPGEGAMAWQRALYDELHAALRRSGAAATRDTVALCCHLDAAPLTSQARISAVRAALSEINMTLSFKKYPTLLRVSSIVSEYVETRPFMSA